MFKFFFISILLWLTHVQCLSSVEPTKACVPTSTVHGPCHTCVCNIDGVYYCRADKCKNDSEYKTLQRRECESNLMYREDMLLCTCNDEGYWTSTNCRSKLRYLQPKRTHITHNLRSNIECIPNMLYLMDCNICRCPSNGFIELNSCTHRQCTEGNKANICKYGDILRTERELCSCSEINYYIDRLCIKVTNQTILHMINRSDIRQLIDTGKYWQRTGDIISSNTCSINSVYTIDCNRCICKNGEALACTNRKCTQPNNKNALRSSRSLQDFNSLPELRSENDNCKPSQKYRLQCNTCICSMKGIASCTTMMCLENFVLDSKAVESMMLRANESHWNNNNSDLPRIRNGESCIPGKIYRLDCNTCRCGEQNSLLCTKMACLTEEDLNVIFHERKPKGVQEPKDVINLRTRMTGIKYPDIPSAKCIPGKLYKKGCKKCFCNEKGIVSCTKNVNCYDRRSIVMLTPNDVRPRFKEEDLNSLEMLPNAATKCEPGKAYKVDCNTCLCLVNKNLLCTKVLCLSLDDMHRVDAKKRTGKPCNRDEYTTDIECLQCSCVKGVTQCKVIPGCKEELTALRLLHGEYNKWKPRLTLSLNEDKCLPQSIYKDDCNKCYCQDDGTLRCTQKTCLNYVQTLQLKKHRLHLQKHGL